MNITDQAGHYHQKIPQTAFQLHLLNQAQPFYQESITMTILVISSAQSSLHSPAVTYHLKTLAHDVL